MNIKPAVVRPGLFRDRREAGRLLAAKLSGYANRPDVLVLALPRGGVPVAYEVARALGAPLDVFVVRKLGVPGYEELAMGAVATGGVRVLNEEIVERLSIPNHLIDAVTAHEQQELSRRERLYRGGRPLPRVRDRTVILVDDGLATGATMHAAIEALRQLRPARIVVAGPPAAPQTCEELRAKVDDVICAITPEPFHAVGLWYQDFSQTTDQEVRDLLALRDMPDKTEAVQSPADVSLIDALRGTAYPLVGSARDYDPLMGRIGQARFALLGEASHGTHEFYRERAEITKRLIKEKNFIAIVVEADWPDAYRVNRYVRGLSDDIDGIDALSDFRRFPTWMWRNTVVVEFIEWLRADNDALAPDAPKVGFYGLDLYSLHASMKAVMRYLEKVDPEAARRARERYSCFDHFGADTQAYEYRLGICVTAIWPRRLTHSSIISVGTANRRSLPSGNITPISATRVLPIGRDAANSMSASSRARSMAAMRYWSALPHTTAPLRPRPIGESRRSANAFDRRSRAAMSTCSTVRNSAGSCLSGMTVRRWPHGCAVPGSKGPSA